MTKPEKSKVQNPCRTCEVDPLKCNKSCQKLDDFMGPIESVGWGVSNTADDLGYRILRK